MRRRIFGVENEYGVMHMIGSRQGLDVDEVGRLVFAPVPTPREGLSTFLRNGGRFYLDVGSHPEYATPECDSVDQLIAHIKAGERHLETNLLLAQAKLRKDGHVGELYVYKNNTDSAGNTYGCHENYLVGRRLGPLAGAVDSVRPVELGRSGMAQADYERLCAGLMPFLVALPLIAGAGKVHRDADGAWFGLSQRALHTQHGITPNATRERGLISSRDEPHADSARYRRLHVVGADALMSETTTLLRIGAIDLVLQLVENGGAPGGLMVRDPAKAVRAIDGDRTGRTPVRVSGGEASALDILEDYYRGVQGEIAAGRIVAGPVEQRVLELWRRALDAVSSGNLEPIERDIEWVTKLRILERYQAKHRLPLSHPRLEQIDLAYHDVLQSRGLYYRSLERGLVSTVVSERDIEQARRTAPQQTRARLRGNYVVAAETYGATASAGVDWTGFRYTRSDKDRIAVLVKDPFATENEQVSALIDGMRLAAAARALQRPPMRTLPAQSQTSSTSAQQAP